MTNAYSLDGLLVFALLFICTCAYFKKVPRLRSWLLSEKKGVWGVFYKGVLLPERHFHVCLKNQHIKMIAAAASLDITIDLTSWQECLMGVRPL
ncbi:hypothetical protein GDO86_003539 [Hymenochirus boettgeri]|uniref:Protein kish n=1 Tax=Hymenochirus boettgeri TaxID=247094 RepID=A0A8T2K4I4_9PIPI|nr:hypothetical protein GDO86_003539 [Hymenochirus boettgeri]